MTVRFIHRDVDHILAEWKNVSIAIWRFRTTVTSVHRFVAQQKRLATEFGEPIGLLQIVEDTAVPPEKAEREVLGNMLRGGREHIAASAVVHEGEGLKASIVRSVVTGLHMAARPAFPHKIFKDQAEALTWHVSTLRAARLLRVPEESAYRNAIHSVRLEFAPETGSAEPLHRNAGNTP